MDARTELLKGIESLPKLGYPGRIVVFGDAAEAVLTGDGVEKVVIAAAVYGKGRLVAIAQSTYLKNLEKGIQAGSGSTTGRQVMATFQNNLKSWLGQGETVSSAAIADISNASLRVSDLQSYKILYWKGGNSQVASSKLLEYLRNGGAFIHAVLPWNWLSTNPNKSFTYMPFWDVLTTVGICYTSEHGSGQEGYSVDKNQATGSSLLTLLKEAGQNPYEACNKITLFQELQMLTKDVLALLSPLLNKAWQKCDQEVKKTPLAQGQPSKGLQCSLYPIWLICVEGLDMKNIKAPGMSFFPGDFQTNPPLKCATVELDASFPYQQLGFTQAPFYQFYPTGFYAPAGQTVKVTVTSGNTNHDWRIRIGCHSDILNDTKKLTRWPTVYRDIRITESVMDICSPFGGLIYFVSTHQPSSIAARLENVVESPRFVLTTDEKKGKEEWLLKRSAPGIWADISGKYVSISLPSSSIREVDDPTEVMKFFDNLYSSYHELRGTDVTVAPRQWYVCDKQTRYGFMHSGTPIVCLTTAKADPKLEDRFILNIRSLTVGNTWAVFHEMGHNMQLGVWVFDGTIEVTVNIFSMWGQNTFGGIEPWNAPAIKVILDLAGPYMKSGADYNKWTHSPFLALAIYRQIIRDFGWDSMKRIFRRYNDLEPSQVPTQNSDKIDCWFVFYSEIAGYSLLPLTQFWGIPLSTTAVEKLQKLLPYLPDDEVTKAFPDRTQMLVKKFPSLVRKPSSSGLRSQ